MPTTTWTTTARKRRISAATLFCTTCAGALIGLSGTAAAAPAATAPAATQAAPAAASATAGQAIVDEASRHAGKPYSYGADGPDSFDCSGFTQFVHSQLGYSIPRTTDAQRAALPTIPKSAAQPGDVIFIGDGGDVYHAGIFAGDGRMWAAPESGDVVRLQNIWTSSYSVGRAY